MLTAEINHIPTNKHITYYWQIRSENCHGSVDCICVVLSVESFYNFITGLLTQDYADFSANFMTC